MRDPYAWTDERELARRSMRLMQRGQLSKPEYVLLQAMLACRRYGEQTVEASYSVLMAMTCSGRATVARAVARFEALGLLRVERRRVLLISPGGGRVWRQLTSLYHLARSAGRREFPARTDSRSPDSSLMVKIADPGAAEAQERLRQIGQRRLEALFGPKDGRKQC